MTTTPNTLTASMTNVPANIPTTTKPADQLEHADMSGVSVATN